MNDLTTSIVNAVTRTVLLCLSAFLLGWALYPNLQSVFAGLTLGVVGGLFNVRYLSIKIRQIADMAVNQDHRRLGFGFVTRLCIAFLVVMLAARLDQVSLGATIAGLFIPQLLTIPVSIIVSLRNKK